MSVKIFIAALEHCLESIALDVVPPFTHEMVESKE
jgi:hypothetical protein